MSWDHSVYFSHVPTDSPGCPCENTQKSYQKELKRPWPCSHKYFQIFFFCENKDSLDQIKSFLNPCPRRRQWHPTPILLPGKSHGQRSLVPWGREESDTERLHFHFSLSCIGEGNGNPLQCSCLENPRDGGAWWAAVYGVAQSQTRLKRLSSSSSSKQYVKCFKCFSF